MKFLFGFILAVLSCFSLIAAEKSSSCLLRHSLNGDGRIACAAFFPSWSYNSEADECVEFIYGGCGGNANRFSSQQECEKNCKN